MQCCTNCTFTSNIFILRKKCGTYISVWYKHHNGHDSLTFYVDATNTGVDKNTEQQCTNPIVRRRIQIEVTETERLSIRASDSNLDNDKKEHVFKKIKIVKEFKSWGWGCSFLCLKHLHCCSRIYIFFVIGCCVCIIAAIIYYY